MNTIKRAPRLIRLLIISGLFHGLGVSELMSNTDATVSQTQQNTALATQPVNPPAPSEAVPEQHPVEPSIAKESPPTDHSDSAPNGPNAPITEATTHPTEDATVHEQDENPEKPSDPNPDTQDVLLQTDHSETNNTAKMAGIKHSESVSSEEQLSQLDIVKNLLARNEETDAESSLVVILQTTTDRETQLQAMLLYGRLLAKNHRYTEASITLEKYVKHGPNRTDLPQVFLELGRIYRQMGAYELSMKRFYNVLNSTIRLANDELDAYRSLSQLAKFEIAETYAMQGDYANARKFFGRIQVLDLPPADRVRAAFREAQTAYQDAEYGRAVPLLRRFMKDYEGHYSTMEAGYMLSVALRDMNLYEDSLRETLNFLKMAKTSNTISDEQWIYWQKRAGNQLANSFYNQGEYANALAIYRALSNLKSDQLWQWPVQYQIGLCYERLNQDERAVEVYESILVNSPENTDWETRYTELREIREIAKWRLDQLKWLDKTQTNLRTIAPAQELLVPKS